MANQSTALPGRSKPAKPYPGFPMFAHPSGQWAKKINRKLAYFGVWANPEAALERLNREFPYLKAGRTPPPVGAGDGCTLRVLANDFLASKEAKLQRGDLSPRTFKDYYNSFSRLIAFFGKERLVSDLRPADFAAFRKKLEARFNVVSIRNELNRIRILFNFAHERQLIEKPVNYGGEFDPPSAKALRRDRNQAGPKMFTEDECLRILDAADVQLKAMTLLALNGGLGNSDVAALPEKAVNFETGFIDYPRVKTEIPRRIPMWPETAEALKAAIAARPARRDESGLGLVFLTRQGRPWVRVKEKAKAETVTAENVKKFIPLDALAHEFRKLLSKLEINGRRGLGFYTCRHVFETQAGESKDQVAVDAIMGHVDSSMAANYRHGVSDARLRAVVNVVRAWLFG